MEVPLSTEELLYRATINCDFETIEILANNSTADLNWKGGALFLAACESESLKVIRFYLNHPRNRDIDFNNAENAQGAPPFCVACREGYLEVVVELLSDKRILVNKPNKEGFPPFFLACSNGLQEVVGLLLKDLRIIIDGEAPSGITPFLLLMREDTSKLWFPYWQSQK